MTGLPIVVEPLTEAISTNNVAVVPKQILNEICIIYDQDFQDHVNDKHVTTFLSQHSMLMNTFRHNKYAIIILDS